MSPLNNALINFFSAFDKKFAKFSSRVDLVLPKYLKLREYFIKISKVNLPWKRENLG